MHGPKKRAGAVAGIEGVRTPAQGRAAGARTKPIITSSSARARRTSRARWASRSRTASINENARKQWLEWKRRTDPLHYLDPKKRAQAWYDAGLQMVREGLIDAEHFWGTINCDGVNAEGRDLRRDDDQRPGVEDSGPRGRLADSRRGALCRRRSRRRRIDRTRRGQPLQPLVVPDRRGDAPRRASEGRGDDGAASASRRTRSRSGC